MMTSLTCSCLKKIEFDLTVIHPCGCFVQRVLLELHTVLLGLAFIILLSTEQILFASGLCLWFWAHLVVTSHYFLCDLETAGDHRNSAWLCVWRSNSVLFCSLCFQHPLSSLLCHTPCAWCSHCSKCGCGTRIMCALFTTSFRWEHSIPCLTTLNTSAEPTASVASSTPSCRCFLADSAASSVPAAALAPTLQHPLNHLCSAYSTRQQHRVEHRWVQVRPVLCAQLAYPW